MDSDRYLHRIKNEWKNAESKAFNPRNRGLTQDTRATRERVLDPRTLQILSKLSKNGYFYKLSNVISSGKEAMVYCALSKIMLSDSLKHMVFAAKIFGTSILVFRHRQDYIESENRYKTGYKSCSNPRKMVKQWAEKEFRNMRRLLACGVRSPIPIALRGHVIIMSLIGHNENQIAPRLKDYKSENLIEWLRIYVEIIVSLRLIYQNVRLVHGDFNEYNILYHSGHPYIIDVSQSTDLTHIHSEAFLKRDCLRITDFFNSKVNFAEIDNLELSDDLEIDYSFLVSREETLSDSENESSNASGSESEFYSELEEILEEQPKTENAKQNWVTYLQDTELYNQDNPWLTFANSDVPLANQIKKIKLLGPKELYLFITNKEIFSNVDVTDFSDLNWPDFDLSFRTKQWSDLSNACRIISDTISMDASEQNKLKLFEVIVTNKANTSNLFTIEHLNNTATQFSATCLQTLLLLTEYRDLITNTDSVGLFMNSLTPASLHELSALETLQLSKGGDNAKFKEYLVSNTCPVQNKKTDQDQTSSDSDRSSNATELELQSTNANKEALIKFCQENNYSFEDQKKILSSFSGVIPEEIDSKKWKQFIKSFNQERRKSKMKKKIKQRKIKKTKHR